MDYIACIYDDVWWIGLLIESDDKNIDKKIKFLQPHGPCQQFTWPNKDDYCWVPDNNIILKVSPPSTTTGRLYSITEKDFEDIENRFNVWKSD